MTALAVSALRPENMAADPELAVALQDFELLAMGSAAFVMAGVMAGFAALVLEHAPSGRGGSAVRRGRHPRPLRAGGGGGGMGLIASVALTPDLVDRPSEAR